MLCNGHISKMIQYVIDFISNQIQLKDLENAKNKKISFYASFVKSNLAYSLIQKR